MKRTLAALALAVALSATGLTAHAGGANPPAKQPYYYCVVVCKGCRNRCFSLPAAIGKPADKVLKIERVNYR